MRLLHAKTFASEESGASHQATETVSSGEQLPAVVKMFSEIVYNIIWTSSTSIFVHIEALPKVASVRWEGFKSSRDIHGIHFPQLPLPQSPRRFVRSL